LSLLADVMRIPYFLALLCALWSAIPRSARASQSPFTDSASTDLATLALVSALDPFNLRRFFGLMVGAGFINAMIAGFVLCRMPESHAPSFASLLARTISYIAIAALAGVGGTWLYWRSPSSPFRNRAPLPFPLFALVCAAGWVWVPSMVIFSEQISAATALVAMIGASILASGIRSATYSVFAPSQNGFSMPQGGTELFAESLYRPPVELHGYVIAIGVYAAVAALLTRSSYTGAALLALSAFLFAWNRTISPRDDSDTKRQYKLASLRLALVVLPAVMITAWALLDGVAHRNRAEIATALAAAYEHDNQKAKSQSSVGGIGGYESLILWPLPEKKNKIALPLQPREFLALGNNRPLIIRFNGVYRYVQPPDKVPGPTAHQAHGTPLAANIESNNSLPLVMDAHQVLAEPIPVARCREIQVEIENRDNVKGLVQMAVLITDAASPDRPTFYLGQQPIVSTEPAHFFSKSGSVFETLRFSVPAPSKIRQFNEITVMMLPDLEHAFIGPKMAIRQFQFFPR
jgi:hypothetical protein